MLHRSPDGDPFDGRLQLSQLRNVVASQAAATMLAENYVGLEQVWVFDAIFAPQALLDELGDRAWLRRCSIASAPSQRPRPPRG